MLTVTLWEMASLDSHLKQTIFLRKLWLQLDEWAHRKDIWTLSWRPQGRGMPCMIISASQKFSLILLPCVDRTSWLLSSVWRLEDIAWASVSSLKRSSSRKWISNISSSSFFAMALLERTLALLQPCSVFLPSLVCPFHLERVGFWVWQGVWWMHCCCCSTLCSSSFLYPSNHTGGHQSTPEDLPQSSSALHFPDLQQVKPGL